jgi:hypothetical protein
MREWRSASLDYVGVSHVSVSPVDSIVLERRVGLTDRITSLLFDLLH